MLDDPWRGGLHRGGQQEEAGDHDKDEQHDARPIVAPVYEDVDADRNREEYDGNGEDQREKFGVCIADSFDSI